MGFEVRKNSGNRKHVYMCVCECMIGRHDNYEDIYTPNKQISSFIKQKLPDEKRNKVQKLQSYSQ